MDVLKRERSRDADLQTRLDSSPILPYTRSLHVPRIRSVPDLDGFWNRRNLAQTSQFTHEATPDLLEPQTDVYVGYTADALWVGFVCHEPHVSQIRRLAHRPPIGRDDNVILSIDTQHRHRDYLSFMLNPLGVKQGERVTCGRGNRLWEKKAVVKDAIMAWDGQAEVLKDKWVAAMRIPFETLGLDGPPADGVWGVNFCRSHRPEPHGYSIWNTTHRSAPAPWAFGDLYFHRTPVLLERIGFGELIGSDNTATLWVRNPGPRKVAAAAIVETFTDSGLTPWRKSRKAFTVPGRGCAEVSIPYSFDVDGWEDQRLRLRILGSGRRTLYEGWYLFGYKNGQKLMVQFPRGKCPANPKPGERDFMDKKRRYIIGRLPRFERATTAQGAPSDFTIRSEDGRVVFNLMAPGALERIARYIHDLFDDENDRLLGANFFVHQPAGMVYSNIETQIVHQLTPLSILRFGSAQCCCHAAVLLGILEKMEINSTGKRYVGHRLGCEGHVITAVHQNGRHVMVDPSVGRFYYLWDDRTLATPEDVAADLALADRAGKHLRKYFEGTARFCYYGCGTGVWPPGAPRE